MAQQRQSNLPEKLECLWGDYDVTLFVTSVTKALAGTWKAPSTRALDARERAG
jgi:hypothetical protein